MKRAYYARCMADYGTDAEANDLRLIYRLGFNVIDFPDQSDINAWIKQHGRTGVMEHWFKPLVQGADVLFYRPTVYASGYVAVGAGVCSEIGWAQAAGKPVLPILTLDVERLTIAETRRIVERLNPGRVRRAFRLRDVLEPDLARGLG